VRSRRPAAILFDKDGTLVDFDRTWGPAALAVMQALAGADEAALARLIEVSHYEMDGLRFRRTSPLIAGSSAAYGPLWAEALRRSDVAALCHEMDVLFRAEGLKSLAPIGDPRGLVRRLATKGHRLGIASNDAEASVRAQADRLGLTPHLAYVAGYDSGHGSKPDPRMITAFATLLGIDIAEVIVIGDSIHDLAAARAAGAVAVAVLSGPAPSHELAPFADHVIVDIDALEALLASMSTG
jgi:phosphoglycolate phosphatase